MLFLSGGVELVEKFSAMTKSEIIELQTQLNKQGFNLVVDGRYGEKTKAAYAAYLDRDTQVPTLVPPAPKPWWASKTALFTLATIGVSLAALFGVELDKQNLVEALTALATLVTSILALYANSRRRDPLDSTLIMPGVRIKTSGGVPAQGKSDSGSPPGPFGY